MRRSLPLSLLLVAVLACAVWAFPTTSLLDSFTRADENPLSGGGNWTGPIESGHGQPRIVSNLLEGAVTVQTEAESYWTTAFGADQEAWFTITTIPGSGDSVSLWLRTTNQGTGTLNGYRVTASNNAGTMNGYNIRRFASGVEADILTTTGTTLANGDQLGTAVINAFVQIWVNHASAGWSLDNSVTDASPVTGAGNIGLRIFDTPGSTIQLSNFGGGRVSLFRNQGDFTGVGTGGRFHKDPLQYRPLRRGIDYDFGDRVRVPYLW